LSRSLLLNLEDAEEPRAALVEDGRLSLLWVERAEDRTLVGNVYKGRVVSVERSIGAAFVDFGAGRPGFLHGGDIPSAGEGHDEPAAQRPIHELVSEGQEIVVQVSRDPVGGKGPSLTARVSLPGRLMVVFPHLARTAVSRKITDEAEHRRLEDLMAPRAAAAGVGVVIRTAAQGASEETLAAEFARLAADARAVAERAAVLRAPSILHEEADFVSRAVRELLCRSPERREGPVRVVVDTASGLRRVEELVACDPSPPEAVLHEGPLPLFHASGVEREVRALDESRVPLPGGASLVIHETEALWAIDVNSGRMRGEDSLEDTALAVDLAAAAEAARQIRLRDLGGLVVVDFIDCVEPENRARVEAAFREELAKDPARMRIAPLSEFMVAEITRRRMRTGPAHAGSEPCPSCRGRGRTRNARSAGLAALREIRAVLADGAPGGVDVSCAAAVADDLDRRLAVLRGLEERHGVPVRLHADDSMAHDRFEVRRAAPARRGS
jgi:Rne/Rng family ribonuclease